MHLNDCDTEVHTKQVCKAHMGWRFEKKKSNLK